MGDRPALAGGEGLAEEREVGERLHHLDAGLGLEVVAERVEVELGLEVVHPRLEDRLAVQADPEAHGVRPGEVGQGVVGEVVRGLLGGEVEVGEDHDARRRVLEDLGPPAGMLARVEPLAEQEPRALEHPDQPGEEPPRRAERVVVVVRPAQPEPVLPGLLDPRRAVPRLPVIALDLEDQVARQVGPAGQLDHPGEGGLGGVEPLGVVVEPPPRPSQSSRAASASRAACGAIRPIRAISPENGSNPRYPRRSTTASVVARPATRPTRYGPIG